MIVALSGGLNSVNATAASAADTPVISGVVVDGGDLEQDQVVVELLHVGTNNPVTSMTTGPDGKFGFPVEPGKVYDLRFTPPDGSGLRTYLATGADASAPLRVILKPITVVHLDGTVRDGKGVVYPNAEVVFEPASGPNTTVRTDSRGDYSVDLLSGPYRTQIYPSRTAGSTSVFFAVINTTTVSFEQSQNYDITVPVSTLTISVRDMNGDPVTGASLRYDLSSVSTPTYSGSTYGGGNPHVDDHGDLPMPVITGTKLKNPAIVLTSGLTIPFASPTVDTDQTITVTIPPSVHLDGTVRDGKGVVYPNAEVVFEPASGPNTTVRTDSRGDYSVDLLSGPYRTQIYPSRTAGSTSVFFAVINTTTVSFEQSQNYDITVPVSTLTISVRDMNGDPVTGASLRYDLSSVSTPTYSGSTYGGGNPHVDDHGDLPMPVITGTKLKNPAIVLTSGLTIPFASPTVDTDQTITVTIPPSVHLDGTVRDGKGVVYPNAEVVFEPASGPNTTVRTDSRGDYSVDLLSGPYRTQIYPSRTAGSTSVFFAVINTTTVSFEQSQNYDITVPVSTLTISVRDMNGDPVTGASLRYDLSSVSTPTYSGSTYGGGNPHVDDHGDLPMPVITGTKLKNPAIVLTSGLTIPLNIPQVTADKRLFLIFDRTTGSILVDDKAPLVDGQKDRTPDAGDWYNAPVTITWTSTDPAPSSGQPTTPPPTRVEAEGANQVITSEQSCDPAGNCASGQATVSIDKTPPTIKADLVPNDKGKRWHHRDLTVIFTCDDLLAGIAFCPAPVTVDHEGAGQEITGTAIDKAGNRASTTVTVNLDKTAPVIKAEVSQAPNGDGWNNADVTVTFTCTDALSGVASCSDPVTLTEDGPDQVVSGTAIDDAGNTTTATVTVSIDKTRPQITAIRTAANNSGWNRTDVTVTFTCKDAVSGIATCTDPVNLADEGVGQSVSGTAVDHAGNTASTTVGDINIDKTAPSIAAEVTGTKNDAGWYNTAPTIHYTCTDSLSGIATCPADLQISNDGARQMIKRTAVDNAGNTREAEVTDINVDLTPPNVTIVGAVNGNRYTLDKTPSISCATTDATSGIATHAAPTVTRNVTGVYTATCSGATDIAGNTAPPKTITYIVTPTITSLLALTNKYVSGSGAPQSNGMIQDLDNKLLHSNFCQYVSTVNKQAEVENPTLTAAQAEELVYWAHILDPTC
ncbi:hypothetical protein Q2K19_25720 [Micromonospora soli]|nr:hypothetical protein [Micromonospora sp. NBRC 110009]WKT97546.1 hypothetical protein Q2K19_25720 [Micromonospora sp. NBRC 110009]